MENIYGTVQVRNPYFDKAEQESEPQIIELETGSGTGFGRFMKSEDFEKLRFEAANYISDFDNINVNLFYDKAITDCVLDPESRFCQVTVKNAMKKFFRFVDAHNLLEAEYLDLLP